MTNIILKKTDQGGDHTTESMETVQGVAAAEQEEEERKEKVEDEDKTRKMPKKNTRRDKKNEENARKICREARNNCFVSPRNDAYFVHCIKYSFVNRASHLSFFYRPAKAI